MNAHGAHERAVALRRSRARAVGAGALALAAGLGGYALAGSGSGTASAKVQTAASARHATSAPGSVSASPSMATVGTPAPNGTFTTSQGTAATISSLRGRPTMVWFVAGGCASCAASIPAVAAHFDQLRAAGLRVLTLGLYGDFPAGKKGMTQLLSFGRAAAFDKPITRRGWAWGMGSKSLSLAYDPGGVPDLYVLIGPTGHIRYRNSVPGSTMGALIAAAKHLGTRPKTTAAAQPCC